MRPVGFEPTTTRLKDPQRGSATPYDANDFRHAAPGGMPGSMRGASDTPAAPDLFALLAQLAALPPEQRAALAALLAPAVTPAVPATRMTLDDTTAMDRPPGA